MKRHGARLKLGCSVSSVEKSAHGFTLQLTDGPVSCRSLVVACGGKSIPKMGATSFGYDIATQFGLRIVETRPALVPLTFEPNTLERLKPLAGVAVDAVVSCGKTKFVEAMLLHIAVSVALRSCRFLPTGVKEMKSALRCYRRRTFSKPCVSSANRTASRHCRPHWRFIFRGNLRKP